MFIMIVYDWRLDEVTTLIILDMEMTIINTINNKYNNISLLHIKNIYNTYNYIIYLESILSICVYTGSLVSMMSCVYRNH